MNDEITICVDMCSNRKCPHHMSHLKEAEGKTIFYEKMKDIQKCPKEKK